MCEREKWLKFGIKIIHVMVVDPSTLKYIENNIWAKWLF